MKKPVVKVLIQLQNHANVKQSLSNRTLFVLVGEILGMTNSIELQRWKMQSRLAVAGKVNCHHGLMI